MPNRVRRGGESAGAIWREVRLTIADAPERSLSGRLPEAQAGPGSSKSHEGSDSFGDNRRHERRDLASRASLVERFRAEFREMPGLWVTQAEARRLFGVPEDICQRVLDALVGEGTLIRTRGGVYRTPPKIGWHRD